MEMDVATSTQANALATLTILAKLVILTLVCFLFNNLFVYLNILIGSFTSAFENFAATNLRWKNMTDFYNGGVSIDLVLVDFVKN